MSLYGLPDVSKIIVPVGRAERSYLSGPSGAIFHELIDEYRRMRGLAPDASVPTNEQEILWSQAFELNHLLNPES